MAIPKVLHRIWVEGSGLLPDAYAEARDAWRDLHPDWEILEWTVPPFDLTNQAIYDAAPQPDHLRYRADVLRLELLAAFGGVYVDMDVVPLRPLDALLEGHTAVAGWSPNLWKGKRIVTNAIMAAEPFHPWMERCVGKLRESVQRYAGAFTAMVVGPHHVHRCLRPADGVTLLDSNFLYPQTEAEKAKAFTYHMWATRNGVHAP